MTMDPNVLPIWPRHRRHYPVLEMWQRTAQELPVNHPICRAACHDAAARDLEILAEDAVTLLERRTWELAGLSERFTAMRILVESPQSACVT